MNQTETVALLTQLRSWEATGRLGGAELEYRTEGSHPPHPYWFEQLRLLAVDGRDTLQFATVAYARTCQPPELVLRFQLPARPQDVQTLARLLRQAQVFTAHYAEQEKPPRAGTPATDVTVLVPGRLSRRRYYGRIPEALGGLREEVEWLGRLVRTKGKLTVFHENFRIGAGGPDGP
jgi:hypothetical protein